MEEYSETYVAFDTSKLRNAVAIAEAGRSGEVRFLGEIENTASATAKLGEIARQLAGLRGGGGRAERAQQYVREQIKRIKLASIESI